MSKYNETTQEKIRIENREYTCIVCPRGCMITYRADGTVSGNKCIRGKEYVVAEATNPVRMVTSTVECSNGVRCAVRTSKQVPKKKIREIMEVIHVIKLDYVPHIGEILKKNISETGADLIVTSEAD